MITPLWMRPIVTFFTNPWVRGILLTLYYLAIIIGLIMMYGKGDFSTPPFIYQGF
jgi:hypothetical protein